MILGATLPALLTTIRALDRQQQRFDPAAGAANDLLSSAPQRRDRRAGLRPHAHAELPRAVLRGRDDVRPGARVVRDHPLSPQITTLVDKTNTAFDQWRNFAAQSVADVRSGNVRERDHDGIEQPRKEVLRPVSCRAECARAGRERARRASRQSLRNEVERALVGLLIGAALGFALALSLWFWWRVWGRRNALNERRLADNAVLLQSVIDATNDPIFAKDHEGKHILANRARAASLPRGDADVDLIGRSVDEFVDRNLAEQIRRDETQIMATGEEVRLEQALQQPDGPHIFLTTESPLWDTSGRVAGVVGVARDIAEDRAACRPRTPVPDRASSRHDPPAGDARQRQHRRRAHCRVRARYQPAIEELAVGGDWYDVIPLPGQMVGLVVGDAVGRGIDAATAMGQLRSALAALAFSGRDPAAALEGLETFARTIPDARSATCAYVIIDPEHEVLRFSSAGHMPPLLITPDGKPVYLDDLQDPPLAATTDARVRRAGTRTFPVGSTLLLFTDGLIERRTEAIDVGLERLAAAVVARDRATGRRAVRRRDRRTDRRHHTTRRHRGRRGASHQHVQRQLRFYDPRPTSRPLGARRGFEAWLKPTMADDQARAEVVLAVGEAITNSIEHAYGSGPNRRVRIRATHDATGSRSACATTAAGSRRFTIRATGRGLPLMHGLMDNVDISTVPRARR